MSQTDGVSTDTRRGSALRGYAHVYAPMAIVALSVIFVPLFDSVQEDGYTRTFSSEWEMAGESGGGISVLAIMLMVALVVLLLMATFRPPGTLGVPVGISAIALVEVVMLLAKPGTGSPKPDLSSAGHIVVTLGLGLCILGIVHAIHIRAASQRIRYS